jgi:putative serine protease PepD
VDRSEGNDDELYPPAPLPAHERHWRHPSEMGHQAWTTSEPPLTIGRGLTAATGAVGGVLALAVLWTMLPTHAGRSAGVSVRSTVATTASVFPPSAAMAPSTSERPTTSERPSTTVPSTSNTLAAIVSTPPESTVPLPTYAVEQPGSVTASLGAVAVAVSDGSLVITTAGAVERGDVVDLRLPDGATEQARVILVDQRTGLAVLAHDTPAVQSFTVAPALQPGDVLSFYGAAAVTAIVQPDGTVDTSTLDPSVDSAMPEGTPVVNQRGELVALCSHGERGTLLVSLAGLDQLRRALASGAADRVWVGVMLGNDPTAGLVVDTLDPAGPAADAGVQAGDRIASVDGVRVTDTTQLGSILAAHAPGDTITFVVQRGDTQITIAVVLGSPRSSL